MTGRMSARVCPDGAGSRASTRLAATRTPAAATAPAGMGLYSNTMMRALFSALPLSVLFGFVSPLHLFARVSPLHSPLSCLCLRVTCMCRCHAYTYADLCACVCVVRRGAATRVSVTQAGAATTVSTRLAATRTPVARTAPAGMGLYSNTTTRALLSAPALSSVFGFVSCRLAFFCLWGTFCAMHGSWLVALHLFARVSPLHSPLSCPCLCLNCMRVSRVHMLISARACV